MQATRLPTDELAPRPTVNPEQLQGSVLVPMVGDRTAAGAKLTEINGQPLAWPVPLHGGPDFMRGAANAAEGSIWASDKGAISRLARQMRDLAGATGRPVNAVYSAMGARSGDHSTMMTDALLSQIGANGVPREAASAFNADMRTRNPDWPGLDAPRLRDVLMNSAGMRKQFVEDLALARHQQAGFPEIGSTRFAISEPALLGQPTGVSGYAISRADPPRVIYAPLVPHPSYNTQLGGAGYVGGLGTPIPREIMFPDFYAARRAAGAPKREDDIAFRRGDMHQIAHQKWLDEVIRYIEAQKER
jgi:hypothetical protein